MPDVVPQERGLHEAACASFLMAGAVQRAAEAMAVRGTCSAFVAASRILLHASESGWGGAAEISGDLPPVPEAPHGCPPELQLDTATPIFINPAHIEAPAPHDASPSPAPPPPPPPPDSQVPGCKLGTSNVQPAALQASGRNSDAQDHACNLTGLPGVSKSVYDRLADCQPATRFPQLHKLGCWYCRRAADVASSKTEAEAVMQLAPSWGDDARLQVQRKVAAKAVPTSSGLGESPAGSALVAGHNRQSTVAVHSNASEVETAVVAEETSSLDHGRSGAAALSRVSCSVVYSRAELTALQHAPLVPHSVDTAKQQLPPCITRPQQP